jgi:hypothetical protein
MNRMLLTNSVLRSGRTGRFARTRSVPTALVLLLVGLMPALVLAEAATPSPAVVEAAPTTDHDDLVNGLSALPLLEGGDDSHRRPESVSYFTSVPRQQAWEFYADHLRALGWEEDPVNSFSGDSGRQSGFRKDGAWLNVGIWVGNVHDKRLATRVNISHAGHVAASSLPRIEPADESVSCFPQVCMYRSSAAYEQLLHSLRERFEADGWQIRQLPSATQLSEQASATLLQMQRDRSHLDIMIGPRPVEVGAEPRTSVQYAVSLAPAVTEP